MCKSTTDIIQQFGTFAIAIAAWTISYIQLKRSRRQVNEDIVFQQKLDNYKLLIRESSSFLEEVITILNELPDFMGTEEEWGKKMQEFYILYRPKIVNMEISLRESSILLPENILLDINNFIIRCNRLLIEHYNFDNELSIDNYNKLCDLHDDVINEIRKDLHVEILNKKLKKRLEF